MPLYEFYCPECRKKFEELCSSAITVRQCPACGAESKRVLSLFRASRSGSNGSSGGCGG